MIRFRMLMIAAGYEDGNGAGSLRQHPLFAMAQGFAPSGRDLASQPTIPRLKNMADVRALSRMGQATVDLYCTSFRQPPPLLRATPLRRWMSARPNSPPTSMAMSR